MTKWIILISIIIIDFYASYTTKKAFKGFIHKTVNGKKIPAPIEAYRRNPDLFLKLGKPFFILSSIEIILIILFIVELLK